MDEKQNYFWAFTAEEMMETFETRVEGLDEEEVEKRLANYGQNVIDAKKKESLILKFLLLLKNPIILILLFGVILSYILGEYIDATIILAIVMISLILDFWQEFSTSKAIEKLLGIIKTTIAAIRNGIEREIPVEEVVPGDILVLRAGDMVPADCLLVEVKDLFMNEANLTGETFPTEKNITTLPKETTIGNRINSAFNGTNVESGFAKAMVVKTGNNTIFGELSTRLLEKPPENEFVKGLNKFGQTLLAIAGTFVVILFVINSLILKKPLLDVFLFSIALAMGITPQLLPAIISSTLAQGAKKLARKSVIVKQPISIENLGSMTVFCADKTGTLTEGKIRLQKTINALGEKNGKINLYANLNAFFQTGYKNPIDDAIMEAKKFDITEYSKLDEIPYDFRRKMLSIFVSDGKKNIIITKGAFENILQSCVSVETDEGKTRPIEELEENIRKEFLLLSKQGYRTLGLAYREKGNIELINKDDEKDMTFLGLLPFLDPPKEGVKEVLTQLKELAVKLKIITGDNRFVASTIGKEIGIDTPRILTGEELRNMTDEALTIMVEEIDIFAEVEPIQKERIILALKRNKEVVGYLGDGINDVTALHVADVGISVEGAVDVAKEAAKIVLLKKGLDVIVEGVKLGRATFANTKKYIYITISANFGNIVSMAGASAFLPFLPLLPKQILLINLITDFPAIAIATDNVDRELFAKPRKWDIKFITLFMVVFGIVSSAFDFSIFAIVYFGLKGGESTFQTSWFIFSIITELLILFVIRTKKVFIKSKPGRLLLIASVFTAIITFIVPYIPKINEFLGFEPLSWIFIVATLGLMIGYLLIAEITKKIFYRYVEY